MSTPFLDAARPRPSDLLKDARVRTLFRRWCRRQLTRYRLWPLAWLGNLGIAYRAGYAAGRRDGARA